MALRILSIFAACGLFLTAPAHSQFDYELYNRAVQTRWVYILSKNDVVSQDSRMQSQLYQLENAQRMVEVYKTGYYHDYYQDQMDKAQTEIESIQEKMDQTAEVHIKAATEYAAVEDEHKEKNGRYMDSYHYNEAFAIREEAKKEAAAKAAIEAARQEAERETQEQKEDEEKRESQIKEEDARNARQRELSKADIQRAKSLEKEMGETKIDPSMLVAAAAGMKISGIATPRNPPPAEAPGTPPAMPPRPNGPADDAKTSAAGAPRAAAEQTLDIEQAVMPTKSPNQDGRRLGGAGLPFMREGETQLSLGDLNEALKKAAEAVRADPDRPDGYVLQSKVLNRLGRFDDAARSAQDALQRDPDNLEALLALAWAQLHLKNYAAAAAIASAAVSRHPEDARAYVFRAFANECLGNREAMLADLRIAADLDPQRFAKHLRRALRNKTLFDPGTNNDWLILPDGRWPVENSGRFTSLLIGLLIGSGASLLALRFIPRRKKDA
ncbi:MAG: tetratricopeptide repeat protein [Elusimicrobiota bacterium]